MGVQSAGSDDDQVGNSGDVLRAMLGVVLLIFYVIVLAFCSMSRYVTVAFVVRRMC